MGFIPFAVLSAASNRGPSGQQLFTSSGTFTVPQGVKSISVVCVGGGGGGFVSPDVDRSVGGGGAGLSYASTISVVPGETYSVVVGAGGPGNDTGNNEGGDSYFSSVGELLAEGGQGETPGGGSGSLRSGGGTGGKGSSFLSSRSGGGGAAGYSGNGGRAIDIQQGDATDGSGGGGAGGGTTNSRGQGGGVGLEGEGANGIAPGGAGSGGIGDTFGGGGSGDGFNKDVFPGGDGGVRIIWGFGRAYPSTNTGDV